MKPITRYEEAHVTEYTLSRFIESNSDLIAITIQYLVFKYAYLV